MEYPFSEIEEKWQRRWREQKTYAVSETSDKPKYYVLDMFPYPSGAGLHVGHPLGYIASDIIARYKRHCGYNVLHPMGYDSFGLPAEQYAIQTGMHPEISTEANIRRYRKQLDKIGFSFDWDREVRTSDPSYYKWTQQIFCIIYNSWFNKKTTRAEHISTLIEAFERNGNYEVDAACEENWHKHLPKEKFFFGAAFDGTFSATDWHSMNLDQRELILMHYRMTYLAESVVNWCPALGTVLANDEIKDGLSERGGHPVVQKKMMQWSMRISAYADRLLEGLDQIDWSESIKEVQRNWIGKSTGASVIFKTETGHDIEVFTTRPDTIFGVSFLTLAPEHTLVPIITTAEQREEVSTYVHKAMARSERERQSEVKTVTGAFTGAFAIHPLSHERIPIWTADYVLAGYGTGAVMAVPCGDQRDYDFAKKFDLPIPNIIDGADVSEKAEASKDVVIANSDFISGMKYADACAAVIDALEKQEAGKGKTNYRLRDAVFSRQRYWGEPIPVYYDNELPHLVSESDLPIILPDIDTYLPTEEGEPPLARASDWKYEPHPQPLSFGEGGANLEENDLHQRILDWQTANVFAWSKLKEFERYNRKNPTEAEDLIWQNIRNKKLNVAFRRQHTIGDFIVDFVCLTKKLIVEIDGSIHEIPEQREYDRLRTEYLQALGYRVIRFTNDQVLANVSFVINSIQENLHTTPLSFGEGLGVRRLEYNTMPGWAGSSWYFLRYMDPKNENEFAAREKTDYWNQVDLYMGGSEHATGHLLYARFWTKLLHDLGHISFDEPFRKLINQGMILGRSNHVYRITGTNTFVSSELKDQYETQQLYVDIHIVDNDKLDTEAFKKWLPEYKDAEFIFNEKGEYTCTYAIDKMSKRWFNVDNPDNLCKSHGADTLRLYEMFLGPVEQSKPWDTKSINGVHNFLRRFWRLIFDEQKGLRITEEEPNRDELKTLHKTIKKITEDLDRYSWNTCVSAFMICVNELHDFNCTKRRVIEPLVVLLSPFAPHIAEEVWESLGHSTTVCDAIWPQFNEEYLESDTFEYPVSFNGKTRFFHRVSTSLGAPEVEQIIRSESQTEKYLDGKPIKKIIVVPGRIVNVVC